MSKKAKIIMINVGLVVAFVVLVVFDYFGRLLRSSSPKEEWTTIFSVEVISGYLPEYLILWLMAIIAAVVFIKK